MAHFYGTLNGCRGEATRLGSKKSGITTQAASWGGAIRVDIRHNDQTGEDMFSVAQTSWHSSGINQELANGVMGKPCMSSEMLDKILSHKEILPALIGLDPELDKVIGDKFKEDA